MGKIIQERQTSITIDPDEVLLKKPQDNSNEIMVFEIDSRLDQEKKNDSEKTSFPVQPLYDSDVLDHVIMKIVAAEPLLSEDDILFLVQKDYTGSESVSRRTIKQGLLRNGLHTNYKRFQFYISS